MPGTTLPVATIDDVLLVLPSFLRPDDAAPVRDGILAGLLVLCLTLQDWAQYAAAQADRLRATGVYEDAIGAESQTYRIGADDPTYRTAILTPPATVSPEAIIAAANAVLKPFTTISAVYAESWGDRAFFFDDPLVVGGPNVYFYDDGGPSLSPDYYSRGYPSEAAQNGGFVIPNREPGAARFFDDDLGRCFLLRVPDLSSLDSSAAPIYQELSPVAAQFVTGSMTAGSLASPVYQNAATAAGLYAAIVNAIDRIVGQSIRWILLADPNLGT